MPSIPIISFNKGLVTPHVDARTDSEAYQAACRVLNNFIARMYGSAERRPGTYYINSMRDSDDPTTTSGVTTCLFVPFIYNKEVAYVLEFTGGYIRVYYEDAVVDEIDSPYLEADLFELQFSQVGDVIWITHEDYAQRKFKRMSATAFTIDEILFDDGPFLPRNDLVVKDGVTLTPSAANAYAGNDLTDEAGAVYDASSEHSAYYEADSAFDNDLDHPNFWLTADGEYENEWVSVQFLAGKTIVQVRIQPFGHGAITIATQEPAFTVKHCKIEASNNGVDWTKISVDGWYGGCSAYNTDEITIDPIVTTTEWAQVSLDNDTAYTYWRVFVYDNYSGYGFISINEIEMLEDAISEYQEATLTASSQMFESGHVGALFSLTQPRETTQVTLTRTSPNTGNSSAIYIDGRFYFDAATGWVGTILLGRSVDNVYWETFRSFTSVDGLRAIQMAWEEEDGAYYRITVSSLTSGTFNGELTVQESTHTGICRVTTYTSATVVGIEILKDFESTDPTLTWAEGAWSAVRTYPSSVSFIEDRCAYGGMKSFINGTFIATVWFSAVGDYDNFDVGLNGADAFEVPIQTTETLSWVALMDNLIVGTTGGTFVIRSSRMDLPLTPDPHPIVRQLSAYPCDPIRPVKANKALLYVSGRQLRGLSYDRNSPVYDSDLTALCEQITASRIVNMSLQTNPDTILWTVHADGRLSAFIYDRENNVMAWAKMPLALSGGGITPEDKSVCVIPDYGSGDDIYVSVHRIINGSAVYDGDDAVYDGDDEVRDKMSVIYLEKFAKRFE